MVLIVSYIYCLYIIYIFDRIKRFVIEIEREIEREIKSKEEIHNDKNNNPE